MPTVVKDGLSYLMPLVLAWVVYRQTLGAKRVETTAAPYSDMAARLERVERHNEVLTRNLRRLAGVLSREVVVVLDWADTGQPPPPSHEIGIIRSVINDLNQLDPNISD